MRPACMASAVKPKNKTKNHQKPRLQGSFSHFSSSVLRRKSNVVLIIRVSHKQKITTLQNFGCRSNPHVWYGHHKSKRTPSSKSAEATNTTFRDSPKAGVNRANDSDALDTEPNQLRIMNTMMPTAARQHRTAHACGAFCDRLFATPGFSPGRWLCRGSGGFWCLSC